MNAHANSVSVLNPVPVAIDRTRQVLFQPFDLTRWMVIGFCAWLATLGESGGGGGGGGWGSPNRRGGSAREELGRALDYLRDNLGWLVPLAIAICFVVLIVGLLVLWLSSRGRFMFLHNVATNRAEIAVPWNAYRAHGNSLFFFRFVFGALGFVIMMPLIVLGLVAIVRMVLREQASPAGILLAAVGLLGAILSGIAFAVVEKLTKDFVVPIMRLRTASCLAAWSELLRLLGAFPGHFTLYILFHIVLSIAIGAAVFAVVLMTCCLAGCLLALPYLGTVLFLPVLVFLRSYSLHYLAQYGPDYDVFQTEPALGSAPSAATPGAV
jgi:hypothetical protein